MPQKTAAQPLKKKSLRDQEFEDDEEEDRLMYEEVMKKVAKHSVKTQGQGESSNTIVEMLIDRMPDAGANVTENYMSPVAHAQMLLNNYKAGKLKPSATASPQLMESVIESEKSHLSTSMTNYGLGNQMLRGSPGSDNVAALAEGGNGFMRLQRMLIRQRSD